MRIGIAADHGGLDLKAEIMTRLDEIGHDIIDFGAYSMDLSDDYPDFVIPLARAVSRGEVERGIAVCGSGVGAAIAANKVNGVRACLVHEIFSARQGVEDDDMNLICLGGRVVAPHIAWDLISAFLGARFTEEERHRRRLAKITALEAGRSADEREAVT